MIASERRSTPRFRLRTAFSFHRVEPQSEAEQQAKAINISSGGVYFVTTLAVCVGETIELLLEIPRRVSGAQASSRLFTGRVRHVQQDYLTAGDSAIGVQLLYYELPLQE
jgi:hypothetical protein